MVKEHLLLVSKKKKEHLLHPDSQEKGWLLSTGWVPKKLFAGNGSGNSWNPAWYFHSVGCSR
uniref:Uncharacterized protein n=1 Tax=Arundo donax TaxID=35708 RepID=A0A0A9H449_ARUDO